MIYRNRIFLGSCEAMRELPDNSVHCCVTSPPYWAQRAYHGEPGMIGMEASPQEWCDRLVQVFREVRRVLRHDGTLWLNVGDKYASRPRGSDNGVENSGGVMQGRNLDGWKQSGRINALAASGLKAKDLIGLPWMLAFALRADGWHLRADIIWHKPACMPSSVEDRPTSSHEYIFLFSKRKR